MKINLILLVIGLLIDTIVNSLFSFDPSYQSILINSYFCFSLIVIMSESMSKSLRWSIGIGYALILELVRFDSYFVTFVAMISVLVFVELFNKNRQSSMPEQFLLGMVSIFIFNMVQYVCYRLLSVINISVSQYLKVELGPTLILNLFIIFCVVLINNEKEDYLQRKDSIKRRGEKILLFHQDDVL